MRIAVLGLEDFGFHLARTLSELGDEVMAVDRNADKVQDIMRHVGKAMVADVADREALKDLGIRHMDVVAVDVAQVDLVMQEMVINALIWYLHLEPLIYLIVLT